ncbi:MAG: sugar-binding domain-containing protein [Acidobacteriota bacterium]
MSLFTLRPVKQFEGNSAKDGSQRNRCCLCLTLSAVLFWFATQGRLWAVQPASAQPPVTKTTTLVLSDEDWKLGSFAFDEGERQGAFEPGFNDRGFRTVKVPGEVQLQIGLQGMDLYYQSKELTLVNEKEWWYRKQFRVPANTRGQLVRVVFEGVDYFASVWLNGEKLGDHEGCFVPFEYEVSARLKYGGENHLAVKVTCPWLPKGRGFLEYMKGELAEVVPGGWVTKFPFAPYVLGPNWDGLPAGGNAVFPMGLHRDVKLVASGHVVIDDLFVGTRSLNPDGSATVDISGKLRNYGPGNVTVTLDLKIEPDNFTGESVNVPRRRLELRPGETIFQEKISIRKPQLWWTWDTGDQNLYKVTATIASPSSQGSDSRETVSGIRTIARKDDMSYWLNGRRLFLKGAWYPIGDYFASKPTRQTYEKDLELYRAANLNHLVNFTVVEKPDFYDLCDRLGILNFFEFPFAQFGPMQVLDRANPRREIFVQQALSQVRQIVVGLRNHPSIVVWAPFAEARMGGKGWGAVGDDFEQYGYQEFAESIGQIVANLAPGSVYHTSYCDAGEQHFWMGNAGMGRTTAYHEHFNANTGFVSEYGSIALPVLETLQKMLTPEEMWSEQNGRLPRWYDLPIDVSAYSYQTSFDYSGFEGVLHRIHQFVDKDIKSVKELVEDSQLYQASIFRYATEAYRRKKYHSINGTRIWAYGEVTPGIRFNFLDYYRTPKMGYYYLKNAQERFAVNFAYEEALESQVSGKRLQIPVWIINDYLRAIPVEVRCEITDLEGHKSWSRSFSSEIGSDESRQIGLVDWTAPTTPGIYVLSAEATEKGGHLTARNRTFIKVTPALFSQRVRALLIGQRKYSLPISKMLEAMGLQVEVIEEQSIRDLAKLRNADEIHQNYDLVWLASFDSLWKLLDAQAAEGLKEAVSRGLAFIHSGGPGSFHGGSIRAALLDFTPLSEAFPVSLSARDDLYLVQPTDSGFGGLPSTPIRGIQPASGAGQDWDPTALNQHGLPGFNRVEPKRDSQTVLMIAGHPLLVTGRFGKGRTLAFTGFTPEYAERSADWDPKIVFPYLLDQEFVFRPETVAYFALFMKMIVAATGQRPANPYTEIMAARTRPLFETLQDQPAAVLNFPGSVQGVISQGRAKVAFGLTNTSRYARLVSVKTTWNAPESQAPYLTMYNDNYFDLAPGETKDVSLGLRLPPGVTGPVQGRLIIEGSNVAAVEVPITLLAR